MSDNKVCCFTGHRPEKLTRDESSIIADLEKEIRGGFHTFNSNKITFG